MNLPNASFHLLLLVLPTWWITCWLSPFQFPVNTKGGGALALVSSHISKHQRGWGGREHLISNQNKSQVLICKLHTTCMSINPLPVQNKTLDPQASNFSPAAWPVRKFSSFQLSLLIGNTEDGVSAVWSSGCLLLNIYYILYHAVLPWWTRKRHSQKVTCQGRYQVSSDHGLTYISIKHISISRSD